MQALVRSRLPRILIAHPGRQHSEQLAWALHEAGMLGKYIHGAPLSARARTAIPADKRLFLPVASTGRFMARRLRPRSLGAELAVRSDMLFDWLVARHGMEGVYDAVVGYEVGCAAIAAAAKRAKMAFILDAASVHHTFQDAQVAPVTRPSFHSTVCVRKDRELAAADLILTCSEMAARTFIAAGIDRDRVMPVPLGVDFESAADGRAQVAPKGITKLLFVGRLSLHKGLDIILSAVETLTSAGHGVELTVVADLASGDAEIRRTLRRLSSGLAIRCLDPMPQDKLAQMYRQHDALILVSRFDSFGLVVPEALSNGCAAIVGPNVGASMCVDNGINGIRLREGSAAELTSLLWSFISDIEIWRQRRRQIALSVERFDWKFYRAHAPRKISDFLNARFGSTDTAASSP